MAKLRGVACIVAVCGRHVLSSVKVFICSALLLRCTLSLSKLRAVLGFRDRGPRDMCRRVLPFRSARWNPVAAGGGTSLRLPLGCTSFGWSSYSPTLGICGLWDALGCIELEKNHMQVCVIG